MTAGDPRLKLVRSNLRKALALEIFVEFSFVVALLAVLGAFNGGRPTTTPPFAVAYLVVSFLVTIGAIVLTRRVLGAVTAGNLTGLRRRITVLVWITFFFSAFLPPVYLNAAAASLPPGD